MNKEGVGRTGPGVRRSRKVGKINVGAEGKVTTHGGCAGREKAYATYLVYTENAVVLKQHYSSRRQNIWCERRHDPSLIRETEGL